MTDEAEIRLIDTRRLASPPAFAHLAAALAGARPSPTKDNTVADDAADIADPELRTPSSSSSGASVSASERDASKQPSSSVRQSPLGQLTFTSGSPCPEATSTTCPRNVRLGFPADGGLAAGGGGRGCTADISRHGTGRVHKSTSAMSTTPSAQPSLSKRLPTRLRSKLPTSTRPSASNAQTTVPSPRGCKKIVAHSSAGTTWSKTELFPVLPLTQHSRRPAHSTAIQWRLSWPMRSVS
mmetsp:Transcript_55278/g.160145  ORF Transcript_55278/g.160145 Transcript_55278/m.160145 type:complete len:239 (-) Transcript_55278:485-1201(-)